MGKNRELGMKAPLLPFSSAYRRFLILFFFAFCVTLLATPAFAESELVPASLIMVSVEGQNALVVDKNLQKLLVYKFEEGTFLQKVVFTVTTGQKGGDKQIEGDLRTPEGIYFPLRFIDEEDLLPEYGVGAYTLDYPNLFDRQDGKTGSGIWIHAADEPLRFLSKNMTRGCVVTSNRTFEALTPYISLRETAVIIENNVAMVEPSDLNAERDRLLTFIERWRSSWEEGRLDSYLDCYHKRFKRQRGRHWRDKKTYLLSKPERPVIRTWPPSIYRIGDRVVARFYQYYRSDVLDDVGFKTLYLLRDNDGWRIVGERWSS
ncbi:murein L,D-transpeptidase family protein, partial [Acidobacteriota bacterium]